MTTAGAAATAARTLRLGGWLGFGLGVLFLAAVLEIGRIPTRTLELEAGGRDLLLKFRLVTRRAVGQDWIAELLHDFQSVATGLALVFVNGLESTSRIKIWRR